MRCEGTYRRIYLALCAAIITIVSYFTYFRGYDQPAALFWDENYHIASAQRYLNEVFFFEQHPPLGKLLIALGEYLVAPNERTDHFVEVEYGPSELLPPDFSFAGYRLFPTVLAWLTAPLLFITVVTITESLLLGLLVSGLYTFDNSIIVHSRAAMLESTQIFSMVLALLTFFSLAKRSTSGVSLIGTSLVFGAAIAAAVATKVNSAVIFVLVPLLFALRNLPLKSRTLAFGFAGVAFVCVYFGIWRVHFLLGERRIEQLRDNGYFSVAEDIQAIVDANEQTTLGAFPRLWEEGALSFVARYADGVPKLDLSKSDENGSPPFFWPLGARAIQYRWEAAPQNTVKYLYLVSNPWNWSLALAAVVITGMLLIARVFFPASVRLKNPFAIVVCVALYGGYLFGISQISRVMYLYHYFVALLFAYILTGLVINEIDHVGPWAITRRCKMGLVCVLVLGSCFCFGWYSPLTYYKPLTDPQVRSRAILSLWDLTCAGCPRTSRLVQPPTPTVLTVRFAISEVIPESIEQEWGQPRIGVSPTDRPLIAHGVEYSTAFGMHSNSAATYPLSRAYSRFTGDVGLPDYLADSRATVIFQVVGDEKVLWDSSLMKPGDPLQHVDVDISEVTDLTLKTLDAGDGITDDHGFWANLALIKKPVENGTDTREKR